MSYFNGERIDEPNEQDYETQKKMIEKEEKDKTHNLQKKIGEILDDLYKLGFAHGKDYGTPHKELDITQALQAILTEIKEGMPEKENNKLDPEQEGYDMAFDNGYNAYHDEMEKLLE
jgi:hypothetical protein